MKKNKIWISATLLLILVFVLAGCQNNEEVPIVTEPVTEEPATEEPVETSIAYDLLDAAELPNFELMKLTRGFYAYVDSEGNTIVWISQGEKPTGGFYLEVVEVTVTDNHLKVVVSEVEPGAEDMVTQAFTYPNISIILDGVYDEITVINTDEEAFNELLEEDYQALVIQGTYVGQIDNNSIEVETEEAVMVFRSYDLMTWLVGIEEGTKIEVTYYEGEFEQLWLTKILTIE